MAIDPRMVARVIFAILLAAVFTLGCLQPSRAVYPHKLPNGTASYFFGDYALKETTCECNGTTLPCKRYAPTGTRIQLNNTEEVIEFISKAIVDAERPRPRSFAALLARILAQGDFDALNELLKGVTFQIPDQQFDIDVTVTTLHVTLKNLICGSMSLQDMTITDSKTPTAVPVTVDVSGVVGILRTRDT